MRYNVILSDIAIVHLAKLRKSEPHAYEKANKLMDELAEHPTTGTGKPHQLTGDKAGEWARRITGKHRLVYAINDTEIYVYVFSAYKHYDDK